MHELMEKEASKKVRRKKNNNWVGRSWGWGRAETSQRRKCSWKDEEAFTAEGMAFLPGGTAWAKE